MPLKLSRTNAKKSHQPLCLCTKVMQRSVMLFSSLTNQNSEYTMQSSRVFRLVRFLEKKEIYENSAKTDTSMSFYVVSSMPKKNQNIVLNGIFSAVKDVS